MEEKKYFLTHIFMNDQQLFQLCKKYGAQTLEARRKFAGLLPEVYRRNLYEKKGFGSIYHFAAVLAGMSRKQVQRVLQLERKFEDKPILKEALMSGEVSINKLARVASIATSENQEELTEKAKILPQKALEVLVRDEKQNCSPKPLFDDDSVRAHRIDLSDEVQNKLGKLQDKGIDINKLLLELLEKREQEIAEEKEKLSQEATPTKSNYIKVAVKKVLQKEHGTKCSIPGCNKDAEVNHHTCRFALSKTHDPKYLAPLYKEHHQIAHSVDTKYRQKLRI